MFKNFFFCKFQYYAYVCLLIDICIYCITEQMYISVSSIIDSKLCIVPLVCCHLNTLSIIKSIRTNKENT